MNIGLGIRTLRQSIPLNQGEFAKALGISQVAISQIERGHSNPSRKHIIQICNYFQVPEYILCILSVKEEDVLESKREIHNLLFPHIKAMADRIREGK